MHEIFGKYLCDDIKTLANSSAPRGQDKPLMGIVPQIYQLIVICKTRMVKSTPGHKTREE